MDHMATTSLRGAKLSRTEALVKEIAKYLPHQGPIDVFVHHNTLHCFEDLPFEVATERVGARLGTEPYWSHQKYLAALDNGRITLQSLLRAVDDDMSRSSRGLTHRLGVTYRLFDAAVVTTPCFDWTRRQVIHAAQRSKLLKAVRPLSTDLEGGAVVESKLIFGKVMKRLTCRQNWLVETGRASSGRRKPDMSFVDEQFVQMLAAYLDPGIARVPMPRKVGGLRRSIARIIFGESYIVAPCPYSDIEQSLSRLQVDPRERFDYLLDLIRPIAGWAGLALTLEDSARADEFAPICLADVIAARLWFAQFPERDEAEHWFERSHTPDSVDEQASLGLEMTWLLARLAVSPQLVELLTDEDLEDLAGRLRATSEIERRRICHAAMEKSLAARYLSAIPLAEQVSTRDSRKSFQMIVCIDDREESLRRHVEELVQDCETFGAAGFFAVDMYFESLGARKPVPLCPVMVTPSARVRETPLAFDRRLLRQAGHYQLYKRLRTLGYKLSRSTIPGTIASIALGAFAILPLSALTFWPKGSAKIQRILRNWLVPSTSTRLELEGPTIQEEAGILRGYTIEQMAARVANVLRGIGLIESFANLVYVVGHGSGTQNNPHASAYECGACGGRKGGPNARAFALMANHPQVRRHLQAMGIELPDSTHFVGGYHDTCSDEIEFFDEGEIPNELNAAHRSHVQTFSKATAANALERCRRLRPKIKRPARAAAHVQMRSLSIREPRPEYGHGTNAFCIVGRRHLTKGLFLDRRSFLVSYDWRIDDAGRILAGSLGACVPVCAGISLEYYFSSVDNEDFGCGTKLPHNVIAYAGVINGFSSDLRTGLPLQTVEVHEPTRLLFLVEAPLQRVMDVIAADNEVSRLICNAWVQIVVQDPLTRQRWHHSRQGFEPLDIVPTALPRYRSSLDYCVGKTSFLDPVAIGENL